jgi:hypothetical protein
MTKKPQSLDPAIMVGHIGGMSIGKFPNLGMRELGQTGCKYLFNLFIIALDHGNFLDQVPDHMDWNLKCECTETEY